MLEIKLGDIPYSIPVSWREVTLSQFKRILNPTEGKDHLTEVESILTGIDYDLLFNSVRPKEENDLLITACGFAGKLPDWFDEPMPDSITISGKKIDFKSIDISMMTTGQYNVFIAIASANPMVWKDKLYVNINNIDTAIAAYLYPLWSGKPFTDQWKTMLPELGQMPFLPLFAVASFFLNKFNSSQKSGAKHSKANQQPKKKKRASKRSTTSGS
jgi:hypothetical protein